MNEQQQHTRLFDEAFALAVALGAGWQVVPPDRTRQYPQRFAYIDGGHLRLWFTFADWHKPTHYEIRADRWPTYSTPTGGMESTHPDDLGRSWVDRPIHGLVPNYPSPVTRAAVTRPMAAIVKQVQSRVIADYQAIYALLQPIADERQKYNDREREAIAELFKACHDEPTDRSPRPRYVRDMPGHLSMEYRSLGSVKLDVTAREAAWIIDLLRESRRVGA